MNQNNSTLDLDAIDSQISFTDSHEDDRTFFKNGFIKILIKLKIKIFDLVIMKIYCSNVYLFKSPTNL